MVEMKLKIKEMLEYEVFDLKTGKVIERGSRELHSWTNNFWRVLALILGQAGGASVSVVNTSGTSYNPYYPGSVYFNAGAGNQNYGIQVGTGTTAESVNDYKLAAQISHGSGDNLLYYDAVAQTFTDSGTSITEVVERNFYNYGTVAITINEVGLVSSGVAGWNTCLLFFRSVLSTPITVNPNTGVRIRISTTVTKT